MTVFIDLRPAVATDALVVAGVYVDSWNEGFGHLLGARQVTDDEVQRWARDLGDDSVQWIVAEMRSTVVGFVGIGPSRDPIDPALGEIDTIAVDPAWWRRGIGALLMAEAVKLLHERFRAAVVWTLAGYERGCRFYEAMGWQRSEETRRDGTQVAYRLEWE